MCNPCLFDIIELQEIFSPSLEGGGGIELTSLNPLIGVESLQEGGGGNESPTLNPSSGIEPLI